MGRLTMEALQELGIQMILAIQVLMPTLDTIMEIFTFLGKIEFYVLINRSLNITNVRKAKYD
jgi:hypothetical protein